MFLKAPHVLVRPAFSDVAAQDSGTKYDEGNLTELWP